MALKFLALSGALAGAWWITLTLWEMGCTTSSILGFIIIAAFLLLFNSDDF